MGLKQFTVLLDTTCSPKKIKKGNVDTFPALSDIHGLLYVEIFTNPS